MAEIRFENVTKRFGSVIAVNDFTLAMQDKEFLTLVGPSGCGKSTTLNLLAGLEDPSAGLIYIDNKMVNDVAPSERDIAMVFQSYALYPHMSVRQNIGFGLKVRGMDKDEIERRVQEASKLLGIADLLQRKPKELSGGQRQRVALGRAITRDPKVFLLDEPLSNLDAKLRIQMRADLKILFERLEGTVVYVTHDQAEALSMADRMAVMDRGKVAQIGTPREVYGRPNSRFVANFIGETNLLTGTVKELGEVAGIETTAGELRSSVLPEGTQVGDSVTCSIRPEKLTVLSNGAAGPNVLEGTLEGLMYLGDHERYFLKLPDGTELKIIEHDTDAPRAREGDTARVGCEPGDIVVIGD